MRQTNRLKRTFNVTAALGVCVMFLCPVGYSGEVMAEDSEGHIEEVMGGSQDEEISTRGIRGQKPRASTNRSRIMKRVSPATQKPSGGSNKQIQALQQQVNALQAQVNALRAVIQVTNGVTTVQSKVIRLQGESVTLKSVKDGVTIESRKNLRLEAKKDMTIKAHSKVQLDAGSALNMKGNGMTSIRGAMIKLNNGKKPVASLGSMTLSGPVGGPGKITSGSPTVMVP